jgi:hypothetical protein
VKARDDQLPLIRDENGYVRPVVDRPTWAREHGERPVPSIAMLRDYDEAAARWLLDRYVLFETNNSNGGSTIVRPDDYARRLLQNPLPRAPMVRGLITHPLVASDGRLIDKPGLDDDSGLYLHLGGELGGVPPTIRPPIDVPEDPIAARQLAQSFLSDLLAQYADYRFESEIDRAVALSARMSILVRKDLDIAPGYLLVGPERGTGKTTLAAIDHVIATGHDIPVAMLEDDEDKAKQTLFAAFASSPTAVLFDNLPASTQYASTALSQAITKSHVETRGFYLQRNVKARTNVALYLTGNAVTLDEDLQSRILEIRFSPERPSKWTHPDWLTHARSIREDVRVKLQFIQRAFILRGGPVTGLLTRFNSWGSRVRDPLLWGLPDVGGRLSELEDTNHNRLVDAQVVAALEDRYRSDKFTAGEVAICIGAGDGLCTQEFWDLRSILAERCPSTLGKAGARALGCYFREYLRRWFQVGARRLRLVETTEKGLPRWRVEVEPDG